jgi:hypothetical protein
MCERGITDLNRDSGRHNDFLLEFVGVVFNPIHCVTAALVGSRKRLRTLFADVLDYIQPEGGGEGISIPGSDIDTSHSLSLDLVEIVIDQGTFLIASLKLPVERLLLLLQGSFLVSDGVLSQTVRQNRRASREEKCTHNLFVKFSCINVCRTVLRLGFQFIDGGLVTGDLLLSLDLLLSQIRQLFGNALRLGRLNSADDSLSTGRTHLRSRRHTFFSSRPSICSMALSAFL